MPNVERHLLSFRRLARKLSGVGYNFIIAALFGVFFRAGDLTGVRAGSFGDCRRVFGRGFDFRRVILVIKIRCRRLGVAKLRPSRFFFFPPTFDCRLQIPPLGFVSRPPRFDTVVGGSSGGQFHIFSYLTWPAPAQWRHRQRCHYGHFSQFHRVSSKKVV
jgi:hypothetical protein